MDDPYGDEKARPETVGFSQASGLLTMYGATEPELRAMEYRHGTMVSLTIPA